MVSVDDILDMVTNIHTGELTVDRRLTVMDSTTGEIYFDSWTTDPDGIIDLGVLNRPVKGIDSSVLDEEIIVYC